jgi:hypothetical protein
MLAAVVAPGRDAVVDVAPARRAIVSWITDAPAGTLALVVETVDGRRSAPLPYVRFAPHARASLDGADGPARIATDIVTSDADIARIALHADVPLAAVAVSVPVHAPRAPAPVWNGELAVPPLSQYLDAFPAERGWCAAAAIAMLLGAHGVVRDVATVAAGLHDRTYGGTGNWTFAVAYTGGCGLTGAVAYLRDLATVEALLAAGLPPALSIAWRADALPGAPLAQSAGHLVVVRGCDRATIVVNDPAHPAVRHVYPRAAFERAWLGHGGVALLVAPRARFADLVRCADA